MSVCSVIRVPLNRTLICLKMVWARLLTAYVNRVLLASEALLASATMPLLPDVDKRKSTTK